MLVSLVIGRGKGCRKAPGGMVARPSARRDDRNAAARANDPSAARFTERRDSAIVHAENHRFRVSTGDMSE